MTSQAIADALDPDICDQHGGWLRRLCPTCKRQAENLGQIWPKLSSPPADA